MPVANREKVKKRKDEMYLSEYCSTHSRAQSLGAGEECISDLEEGKHRAFLSTPTSPWRKLKVDLAGSMDQFACSPRTPKTTRKQYASPCLRAPNSAPARSDRISGSSHHSRDCNSGAIAPPPFGLSGSEHGSPRTRKTPPTYAKGWKSPLQPSSDHSRGSTTQSPRRKPRFS
jgi:hypothetical protein